MEINETQVKTYKLSGLDRLDPVSVYVENFEPGKGKVTIECYGKAWSSYWGGMGGDTVEAFLCRVDEHYIAKNLSSIDSSIVDFYAISEAIGCGVERETLWLHSDKMEEAYGPEWFMDLPTTDNPDYQYLCRIIRAVKDAMARVQERAAA